MWRMIHTYMHTYLRSSMANVLKNYGPPDAAATAEFCDKVDKFFDASMCTAYQKVRGEGKVSCSL